jgi:hypothetical protein
LIESTYVCLEDLGRNRGVGSQSRAMHAAMGAPDGRGVAADHEAGDGILVADPQTPSQSSNSKPAAHTCEDDEVSIPYIYI